MPECLGSLHRPAEPRERGSNTHRGGTWECHQPPDPIETPIVPHRDPRPPPQGSHTGTPTPPPHRPPVAPRRNPRPHRDPQWSHTETPDPTGAPHRNPAHGSQTPQGPPGTPYRDTRQPRDPRWHNTGTRDPPETPPGPHTGTPHRKPRPHRSPGGPILGPQTLQEPPEPSYRDPRPHTAPQTSRGLTAALYWDLRPYRDPRPPRDSRRP